MQEEFEQEWKHCVAALFALLVRLLRDRDLAEEALAAAGAHCWRGYATFQRRSTFFTWAARIAQNEGYRLLANRRPIAALDGENEPQVRDMPDPEPGEPGIRNAIDLAQRADYLTQQQAAVLRARLESPEAGWDAIGQTLGLNANRCAVAHFRAIADLRVYLFVCQPNAMGGRREIELALAVALKRSVNPLTNGEAQAFEQAVIKRSELSRRAGISENLRQACIKVATELGRSV